MPRHARSGEQLVLGPWRWLLLPLWLLYRPLVALRNLMFDLGWRQVRRLPVPVVSVGNLAVGGTGKTPLVAWLCEELLVCGKHPQVLSRGYRADATGRNEEAELVPVPVVCDPQRFRGGQQAIAAGADCCLLDDGFQHRQLFRDCNIITIDATRPWGRPDGSLGQTLPLGLLREGPAALRRADVIILSRVERVSAPQLSQLREQLNTFTAAEVISCSHQLAEPECLVGGDSCLVRGPVVLVSGIGNPQAYEEAMKKLGYAVVEHHIFPDHHHFSDRDVAVIAADAAQHQARVMCTEKDAIKLRRCGGTEDWLTTPLRCTFAPADQERLLAVLRRTIAL